MSSPSLAATGDLASEIHALLRETDPIRWTAGVADRARVRWARIRLRVQPLRAAHETMAKGTLDEALAHIAVLVHESSPEPALETEPRRYWMELRARLMPAYERLAAQLRARSLRAPTLRPTNWWRIGFHMTSAIGALLLLEVFLTARGSLWATGAFAATCWFLETARTISPRVNDGLMSVRFFQRVIHPHEHVRVNSATWYGTALFLLAITAPPFASAAALAALGVGDPLAGLVGRRWGRRAIGGGRTLEGSLAFVAGATLAAFGVLSLWHAGVAWPLLLVVAAVAAVGGATAEALSHRVDDNFSVPVASAAAAWAAGAALGLVPALGG
jgi:dolichol kinase